jgi:glucosamine-6-phosphate deaminase
MTAPLTVFPDAAAPGGALAAEIADGIGAASADGRRYLLGCPGGRSPRPVYRALTAEVARRGLDMSGVVIVMMDDYVVAEGGSYRRVSADEHYSCENFALNEIAGPLNAASASGRISPDQVWLPDPSHPADYDERLRAAGGIDLFILASGESDGHVAFNPPGTAEDSRTRVVRLAESTRRDNLGTFPRFRSIDEVPRYGVTVGIATIAQESARSVLIATGRAKRIAVSRVTTAAGYEPDWPATVIAACRDAAVYADRAAASLPEAMKSV